MEEEAKSGLLFRDLPAAERRALEGWWRALSPHDRRRTRKLLADASCDGEERLWEGLSVHLVGTVDDPPPMREDEDPFRDLREYIANHEEIRFFMGEEEFHICRAHTQAKEILERGALPAAFECSLRDERCPWVRVSHAADRRPVRIDIRAARDSRSTRRRCGGN